VAVVQRGPLERLRTGGHATRDPSSGRGRLAAVCALLIALLAGCGGDESLPDTLGYVPPDAHLVALVPTDLDGDQWRRFDHLVAPTLRGSQYPTVRDNLRASIPDVDFDDELEPLLGETLVVATFGLPKSPRVLAILHTRDPAMAKRVAEGVRNGDAVADGSTLVVELDGTHYELDAAVDRHKAGTGLGAETFAKRFGDGAGDDALVRVLADGSVVPGIKSAALAFRLDDDAVKLHLRAHADDPRRLEQVLTGLARGERQRWPGIPDSFGILGDRLVVGGDSVQLALLGKPTSDVEASGDEVEGELTFPLR
jgi:hypothetical protein